MGGASAASAGNGGIIKGMGGGGKFSGKSDAPSDSISNGKFVFALNSSVWGLLLLDAFGRILQASNQPMDTRTMSSRLRIKLGSVEFEYEGEAEFTQDSIKDLFSHMEKLSNRTAAISVEAESPSPDNEQAKPATSTGGIKLHTTSIASQLNTKTATDLAVAAAAYRS
jgi:hypothetical protein